MKLSAKLKTVYDCKAFTYWLRQMLTDYFSHGSVCNFKAIELKELDKNIKSVDEYTIKLNDFFNDTHFIKCEITAIKTGINVVIRFISF